MSFADLIRPIDKRFALTYDFLCVLAGSLFLALMAQIAFPLWFTPVPLTLQTLAVFLIGAILGPKRGVAAILTYFAEGLSGLPVFAGGSFGMAKFLGPTSGYFLGFLLAVYVIGFLLERKRNAQFTDILAIFALGSILISAVGAFGLSFFVGPHNAINLGITPFLFGDLLKVVAATSVTYSFRKLIP